MRVKHMQVKLRDGVTRITVLFDKSVPDTVVRCGMVAMLGWKASKIGQWVTSANAEKGTTKVIWEWEHVDMVI